MTDRYQTKQLALPIFALAAAGIITKFRFIFKNKL